jgi:hypothetical protein
MCRAHFGPFGFTQHAKQHGGLASDAEAARTRGHAWAKANAVEQTLIVMLGRCETNEKVPSIYIYTCIHAIEILIVIPGHCWKNEKELIWGRSAFGSSGLERLAPQLAANPFFFSGAWQKRSWRRGPRLGGAGAELTYLFGGWELCTVCFGVAVDAHIPKPTRIQMVLPIWRGNCQRAVHFQYASTALRLVSF